MTKAKTKAADNAAITVLVAFSASENGTAVDHYPAGQYESLPPTAAKYAIATGAVSEEDAAKLAERLEQERLEQESLKKESQDDVQQ